MIDSAATVAAQGDEDEELGDLLLEILPPDGSSMGNVIGP